MEDIIKVYAYLDEHSSIIAINSSVFLSNTEGYIEIDTSESGRERDVYVHAQGNYLEKSVHDEQGRPNYRYTDNKVIELSEEEKEELYPVTQEQHLTNDERIDLLEQAVQDLILSTLNI